MIKQVAIAFLITINLGYIVAQKENLEVSDEFTLEELVEEILVSGACLNVQNVKAIGDGDGIGYFKFEGEAPLLKEGILLTTGFIKDAVGPNISSNTSGDRFGLSTDKDLDLVATREIYDPTGIEFDFVPFDSIVQFRFQFASEEYCEYVGKEFNDVFGFFVSGPGINGPYSDGAINLALIPSTIEEVSVNTINPIKNRDLYISSITNGDSFKCNHLPFQKTYENEMEYDGFILPIEATFRVVPCEKYHIRMVIADVADKFLDSGVFLEKNSFQLGGDVTVSAKVEGSDENFVQEGCGESYFVFERANPNKIDKDIHFIASISPTSTAQKGIDYLDINLNLTIPAFESSISWPVNTILDKNFEAVEDILLELELPCKCSAVQAELKIIDTPPLTSTIDASVVCKDFPTVFTVSNFGGIGPFNYLWDTGEQSDSVTKVIHSTTSVKVQVIDYCGQKVENEIEVIPIDGPTATISGETEICDVRQNHYLPIQFTGNGPWNFAYTYDGLINPILDTSSISDFNVPVEFPGGYSLVSVTDKYCNGNVSGFGLVKQPQVELRVKDCNTTNSGQIEFEFTGKGVPEYSLNSGNTFQAIETIRNLEVDQEYTILLKDSDGCTNYQNLYLPTSVGFKVFVPSSLVKFNQTIQLVPEINFPKSFIKEIKWIPEIGLSCIDCLNPSITATESRTYRLIITDFFGCNHESEFEIKVDLKTFYVPNIFSPFNNDGINDRLLISADELNTQEIKTFEIFDRWGNQVYEENNFTPGSQKGWNGLLKNQKVASGVFVYRIIVELIDGRFVEDVGDITVVE